MFKYFLDNGDDSCLDTFIDEDGDFGFGIKLGERIGFDLEDETTYLKVGDNFGIDL